MSKKAEDFINHYGILGMKWGRRKSRSSKSKKINNKRVKNISADKAEANKIASKKIYELSNEELKKINTRLQLEKQYKELNPKKVAKGKKFIKGMLEAQGKQLLGQALTKYASKGLDKIMAGNRG
jgi:hypothetical protein